jgi:type II secretory pathway pseudopilin PulG
MTKAFTLIEVLIAVAIVFTAGLGLLSASSNSGKIISYAKEKEKANSLFSLAVLNDICSSDIDTNLYDALKTKFALKDDNLISALKEQNLTCTKEEVLNVNLADIKEIDRTLDDIPKAAFTINKISAGINGANTIGYEIKALM